MDATGDGSKVQCCREQYCIGTWNVRFMTQGKLEVVKQEMVRLNIDIWRISKINWSEMGEFNSDDHYIYYCGQEFLKWSSRHSQQKNLKYSTWMQSQKWQNNLCSFQRQTIQYYSNPSLCPMNDAEETETEWFDEDLQDLLELTPPKRCLFHYRRLECKTRKSRATWSNRQTCPWSTEWSRAKVNRLLPREHTGHSKHPLPTT